MKFLDKLGLALFSIIILVISVVLCLIAFGWMESTIFSILIGKILLSQTYTYIMVGVCVFLILLAIRCIFFSEPKEEIEETDDGILLQNEDGRLLITVETLKNMVEGVINSFSNITNSAVGVIITKENNIIISVSIDVTKDTIIKDTSSKLQVKIKKAIKDATDLDIESVNVRVRNVEENFIENDGEEIEKEPIINESNKNRKETEKNKDEVNEKNQITKVSETKYDSKKKNESKSNKKVNTKNKSK